MAFDRCTKSLHFHSRSVIPRLCRVGEVSASHRWPDIREVKWPSQALKPSLATSPRWHKVITRNVMLPGVLWVFCHDLCSISVTLRMPLIQGSPVIAVLTPCSSSLAFVGIFGGRRIGYWTQKCLEQKFLQANCVYGYGLHGKPNGFWTQNARKSQLCLQIIWARKEHPSQPFCRLLFSPNPICSLSKGVINNRHNNNDSDDDNNNSSNCSHRCFYRDLEGEFQHTSKPISLMVISV